MGAVKLGGGSGDWAWHIDGLVRDTDDYEIPGFAVLESEEEEEHEEEEEEPAFVTVPNTDLETAGGRFGFTRFFGERGSGRGGHFGVAVSGFDTEYGIPEGAHGHGEEEHDDEHARRRTR